MTLYLKYRPQTLDELDLTEVRESLKKIVSSGKIPHAFLFAGPKGTGKTSAARILAKILNCDPPSPRLRKGGEPCNKCEQCISIMRGNNLDVIELDAASHRGIDDVRALREAVKLAPAKAKKKIYIIDEAHMLTTEASNALLKTLEEPPSHVYFILATTNPEKLIETIRSRATPIPFKKATPEEIIRSLRRAISGEKIKIDEEAISLVAKASDGAFRDAVKMLEQLVAEGKPLTKEFLEDYILSKKYYDLDKFIELLIKRDVKSLIEQITHLTSKGVGVENFIEVLLKRLRMSLLSKMGIEGEDISQLSKEELLHLIELLNEAFKQMPEFPIEELPLEIAMIKWCDNKIKNQNSKIKVEEGTSNKLQTSDSEKEKHTPYNSSTTPTEINNDVWRTILTKVRPVNASIEALLRAARPIDFDGKTLTLGVFYRFHKERLEDGNHRRILEEVVGSVLQSPIRIVCTLTSPPAGKVQKEETVLTEGKDTDIIKVAEEIFGN